MTKYLTNFDPEFVKQSYPTKSKNYNIPSYSSQIKDGYDIETKNISISFNYYLKNQCEICDLDRSPSRKALTKIRDIGMTRANQDLKSLGLYGSPVTRGTNYKFLYKDLDPDIDIFEYDIGSTERLFFFRVLDVFNVRLIKKTHIKY